VWGLGGGGLSLWARMLQVSGGRDSKSSVGCVVLLRGLSRHGDIPTSNASDEYTQLTVLAVYSG